MLSVTVCPITRRPEQNTETTSKQDKIVLEISGIIGGYTLLKKNPAHVWTRTRHATSFLTHIFALVFRFGIRTMMKETWWIRLQSAWAPNAKKISPSCISLVHLWGVLTPLKKERDGCAGCFGRIELWGISIAERFFDAHQTMQNIARAVRLPRKSYNTTNTQYLTKDPAWDFNTCETRCAPNCACCEKPSRTNKVPKMWQFIALTGQSLGNAVCGTYCAPAIPSDFNTCCACKENPTPPNTAPATKIHIHA